MGEEFKDFEVEAPVLTLEPDLTEEKEEITKKVNQSKYEKYCYITNRLRREQFPLGLFKYSSKIENYICSILCIRYIF